MKPDDFRSQTWARLTDELNARLATLRAMNDQPTDWLTAASAGAVTKNGTWSGALATGGDIGHFRIQKADRTVTYMQGTAGTSGTDMIIDNDVVTAGQSVTVTACSFTDGNA